MNWKIIFFILIASQLKSQILLDWSVVLGDDNQSDHVNSSILSSDGDIYLLGHQNLRWRITKTDHIGNVIWKKQFFNSHKGSPEYGIETLDKGIIIVGDNKVLKLDSTGTIEWHNTYKIRHIRSIDNHSKGYILCGSWGSQPCALLIDKLGNEIWKRNYDLENDEYFTAVLTAENDQLLFTGAKKNEKQQDAWLVLTDELGDVIWEKTIGDSLYDYTSFNCLRKTMDNNYIFVGFTQSEYVPFGTNRSGFDSWVVKFDLEGKILWSHTVHDYLDDRVSDVFELDKEYVLILATRGIDGYLGGDYLLAKINQNTGEVVYQKYFGGKRIDRARKMHLHKDQLIIIGETDSKIPNSNTNPLKENIWMFGLSEF